MKTHQLHSNVTSMWTNESSEEALSEIAHIVDSLGDGDHEFVYLSIARHRKPNIMSSHTGISGCKLLARSSN